MSVQILCIQMCLAEKRVYVRIGAPGMSLYIIMWVVTTWVLQGNDVSVESF